MTTENNTETALASPANVATWVETRKKLMERIPADKRDDLALLSRPSPTQLSMLVEKLPEEDQEVMLELASRTNPKKQGAHGVRQGFQPIPIRLYQGTGNDPMRPAKLPPGEYYTGDSRKLGESFTAVVLNYFDGRTLWPARESGDKNPICSSVDRKTGSKYGSCAVCPNADRKYNEGGCALETTFYLMITDKETAGIYTLTVSKTSYGAGTALKKIVDRSNSLWDRLIKFEAQERQGTEDKSQRWFVIKAGPVTDPKNSQAGYSKKQLHPLFDAFSRVIDADVYYPMLADTHDRSKANPDGAAPAADGETVDEAALLGNTATTGDNPDFSTDV